MFKFYDRTPENMEKIRECCQRFADSVGGRYARAGHDMSHVGERDVKWHICFVPEKGGSVVYVMAVEEEDFIAVPEKEYTVYLKADFLEVITGANMAENDRLFRELQLLATRASREREEREEDDEQAAYVKEFADTVIKQVGDDRFLVAALLKGIFSGIWGGAIDHIEKKDGKVKVDVSFSVWCTDRGMTVIFKNMPAVTVEVDEDVLLNFVFKMQLKFCSQGEQLLESEEEVALLEDYFAARYGYEMNADIVRNILNSPVVAIGDNRFEQALSSELMYVLAERADRILSATEKTAKEVVVDLNEIEEEKSGRQQ